MEKVRLAPLVGILAAILTILLLVGPYLLVQTPGAIGTYYRSGAITPFVTGLFAVLSILVLAAGREERTDPAMAAGATLVMGTFGFLAAILWAITVPIDVVTQMSTDEIIAYHRWALVIAALGIPLSAGWFARTMRLF